MLVELGRGVVAARVVRELGDARGLRLGVRRPERVERLEVRVEPGGYIADSSSFVAVT